MTKYKLLKELPGIPVGEIIDTEDGYFKFHEWRKKSDGDSALSHNYNIRMSEFPDWFQPIDEKQEELDKAIEVVKKSGYTVTKIPDDLSRKRALSYRFLDLNGKEVEFTKSEDTKRWFSWLRQD